MNENRPLLLALDLESVLVPEIWEAVARRYRIPELMRTTRDEGDYAALMRMRLKCCSDHQLRLPELLSVVEQVEPFPGAVAVLDQLRKRMPVAILSDTFHDLAAPLMKRLGLPLMLCHQLVVDGDGNITDFCLRGEDSKRAAVLAFQKLGYCVIAAGDSLNDIGMLNAADHALLVSPCNAMISAVTTAELVVTSPPEILDAVNRIDS